MKTILTIITSLLLTATAAAKGTETNSSEAMKKDVERFIKADDKKTGFSHPGTGHYVWNFKYLLNESDAASGRLPQSLKKIDRAFERHTGKATTVLTHSPSDGDSPFHWLSFSWPDTYWSRICFRYNMRDDFTYRFATFTGPDSLRTLYGIVWRREMFYDKDSLPCHTIDGYLIKMTGRHWRIDDLNTTYVPGRNQSNKSKATPTDTTAFVELREKTKYITGLYATHKGM